MANPKPVTVKELAQLPRRAIVAFAVRCAKRVRPLAPDDERIDRAIEIADKFAFGVLIRLIRAPDGGAYTTAAAAAADPITNACRRDFETLKSQAKSGNWTSDTPVSQDVFGEMWPDGAPVWWSQAREQSPSRAQELLVHLDPGSAPPEFVAKLIGAISDLHEEQCGVPLKIARDKTKSWIVEGV